MKKLYESPIADIYKYRFEDILQNLIESDPEDYAQEGDGDNDLECPFD